ncbi:MAG: hypothetical protein QM757_42810 [Paludibaculum sp.]
MKYWTYFVAKLVAAAAVLDLLWRGVSAIMPPPETFMRQQVKAFPQDLRWTSVMFLFWLLAASFLYLIVWDQKGRCRTCLRRLRMPVESGSWSKADPVQSSQDRIDLPVWPRDAGAARGAHLREAASGVEGAWRYVAGTGRT